MNALRDWTQLLCVSALFTVPGDALAGAAAAGVRADRSTLRAIGCSLCLYEAGMALNDWADQDEDARERPNRTLPSGRIRPVAALGAAVGLTGVGLALAARAGRPAAAVAGALAATVWAYDLKLKHTPAGAVAMGAARGLDLLLGAVVAGQSPLRPAVALSSAALAAHTYAVTRVSRYETTGGSSLAPFAALATSLVISTGLGLRGLRSWGGADAGGGAAGSAIAYWSDFREPAARHAATVCRAAFAWRAASPHRPSPPPTAPRRRAPTCTPSSIPLRPSRNAPWEAASVPSSPSRPLLPRAPVPPSWAGP